MKIKTGNFNKKKVIKGKQYYWWKNRDMYDYIWNKLFHVDDITAANKIWLAVQGDDYYCVLEQMWAERNGLA